MNKIKLVPSWAKYLDAELEKPYMQKLLSFLSGERKKKKIIFPEENNVFKALELTSFENVKVVILGQDPYHNTNQAHGLSFSVQAGVDIPPSLANINKTPVLAHFSRQPCFGIE